MGIAEAGGKVVWAAYVFDAGAGSCTFAEIEPVIELEVDHWDKREAAVPFRVPVGLTDGGDEPTKFPSEVVAFIGEVGFVGFVPHAEGVIEVGASERPVARFDDQSGLGQAVASLFRTPKPAVGHDLFNRAFDRDFWRVLGESKCRDSYR